MRIVIDLQGAQTESRFRGIGRYSLSLAQAMARNAGEHEIWLILSAAFPETILDIRHAFDGLIPQERIRVFDVPRPILEYCDYQIANAWRTRAAEKIRECFIQQFQPDAVLVASLFEGYWDDSATSVGAFCDGTNTAIVLYDLIPFLNPGLYLSTLLLKQYYDRKIQSLKNAGLLLAISDYSRLEAIEALELNPDRVATISTAVDERFRPCSYTSEAIASLYNRLGVTRKMVLYAPGGFDVRKNFDSLFTAYAMLPSELRANYQLVIVGKQGGESRGDLQRLRKQAGLAEDELVLTDYVSDNDLVALYNLATLFVFPSKHEGFGLPVLEAMSCGTPTIGSNTTSIPEVIGWDFALFDPNSAQSIADKMAHVLENKSFRGQLREYGLRQAKRFSWDISSRRAISAIEAQPKFTRGCKSSGTPDRYGLASLLKSLAEIDTSCKASNSDLLTVARAIAFNTGSDVPRQLLLDISVIIHEDAKSGIQRVVRSILLELLNKSPDGYEVRPIYFDGQQYLYATRFISQFLNKQAPVTTDEIAEFNQDDIYLALDLNAHLTQAVHPLHRRLQCIGVHMYFVVYDILLVKRPDWWPAGTSTIFEEWLKSISQVATGLICISAAVADEVRAWLKHNPPSRLAGLMVSSFHLGADVENSLPTKGLPEDANAVLNLLKAKPSFLMVGTLEPRKGHTQTLAAIEQLWTQGTDANLVIVGKQGWQLEALVKKIRKHPELNKRLFWLEGISDEYLEKVYAACTCLVAASEGEGFGLPLIEAAQHKLPIIARDLPVFREVAGEHAFYFSGLEPQALADAIKQWLMLKAEGRVIGSGGIRWLTWHESTAQLLDVFMIYQKRRANDE